MKLDKFLELKLGGTKDTAALGTLAAGVIGAHPSLLGGGIAMAGAALCVAGTNYIVNRMARPVAKANVLDAKLDIRSAAALTSPDGLLLGFAADTGNPVYLPDEDLMRHGIILGQSGVGKTVLGKLMMFQQIQRGGGLMFIDGKMNADDINTIYQYCKYCGREKDLLILNPGKPELSHTYNPILYGDPDEIAARVLSLIPSTENNPGADHYKQSANQGISTLVAALQAANLAFNFIDFTILLMNHKAIEDLEVRLKRTAPNHPATKNLSLFLEQYKGGGKPGSGNENMVDIKRLKETFGGIGGRMYMFGTGKFGEVLNTYTPDINLFEAIRSNKIVYAALPTMGKNEAASNFGKMLLGDLRTSISWVQGLPEAERPWPPYLTFMDEVGSYAVASLARPFEQARSAQIALFPAAQTLANLEVVSPDFKEMVVGNTWTKIFFKLGTQGTAEECADLIGQTIGVSRTLAIGANTSASSPTIGLTPEGNSGESAGLNESEKEQEEYKVTPDELKSLGKGECVVMYGGDTIFNVKVPMLELGKALKEKLGPFRLEPIRHKPVIGADYFKNSDKYIGGKAPNGGRAKQRVDMLADE